MANPETTEKRIAGVFPDGSMNVFPENSPLQKAKDECWDKNEHNLANQAKIVLVSITPTEVLFDPTKDVLIGSDKKCPHCGESL